MREGYDMAVRFKSTTAVAVENAGLSTLGGTQEVTELPQTNGRSKGAESEQARGSGGSTSRAALVMRPFALNPRVHLLVQPHERSPTRGISPSPIHDGTQVPSFSPLESPFAETEAPEAAAPNVSPADDRANAGGSCPVKLRHSLRRGTQLKWNDVFVATRPPVTGAASSTSEDQPEHPLA